MVANAVFFTLAAILGFAFGNATGLRQVREKPAEEQEAMNVCRLHGRWVGERVGQCSPSDPCVAHAEQARLRELAKQREENPEPQNDFSISMPCPPSPLPARGVPAEAPNSGMGTVSPGIRKAIEAGQRNPDDPLFRAFAARGWVAIPPTQPEDPRKHLPRTLTGEIDLNHLLV